MSEWISVKDRLPENDEEYFLVYSPRYGEVCLARYEKSDNAWYAEDFFMPFPSHWMPFPPHWMPLPEPPKDGDGNG